MRSPVRCRCHLNLANALFLLADLRFEGVMLAATKMIRRKIKKKFTLGAQDDIEGKEDPAPGHTLSKCATAAGPSFARKDSKQRAKVIQPCSVAVEHKIEGRQQRTKLMAGPRVVVARPAKLAADRGLTQPKPSRIYIYM